MISQMGPPLFYENRLCLRAVAVIRFICFSPTTFLSTTNSSTKILTSFPEVHLKTRLSVTPFLGLIK
jgi:hypothetical protein